MRPITNWISSRLMVGHKECRWLAGVFSCLLFCSRIPFAFLRLPLSLSSVRTCCTFPSSIAFHFFFDITKSAYYNLDSDGHSPGGEGAQEMWFFFLYWRCLMRIKRFQVRQKMLTTWHINQNNCYWLCVCWMWCICKQENMLPMCNRCWWCSYTRNNVWQR